MLNKGQVTVTKIMTNKFAMHWNIVLEFNY